MNPHGRMTKLLAMAVAAIERGEKIVAGVDVAEALRAELAKPLSVEAPEEWQLAPKELTAENGAKSALIGEFFVEQEVNCPECDAEEHDVGACSMCHGEGILRNKIPVPWTTIKLIWRRAIEHFDAAPQSPAPVAVPDALTADDLLRTIGPSPVPPGPPGPELHRKALKPSDLMSVPSAPARVNVDALNEIAQVLEN